MAPLARRSVEALRKLGHRVERAPWRGRILDSFGVVEPVIVVDVWIDPESTERLADDTARAARDMKDHLVYHGLTVGGMVCEPSQVWVRGQSVAKAA